MTTQPQKKRATSHDTWIRRIHRFPPILVRLLARDRYGEPFSSEDIAARSGLNVGQVYHLSWLTSWKGVPLFDHIAFCRGCNLDLMNSQQAKRQESYLNGKMINGVRKPPLFEYLKRHTAWGVFYRPMMEDYVNEFRQKTQP